MTRAPAARSWRKWALENVLWFCGSLILAFLVWASATAQSDPVEPFRLSERVPIRLAPDPGLVITNLDALTDTAGVRLQAQRSVRLLLAPDDVIVTAELAGLGAGTHTVPLQARIARQATLIDLSPRQITVELELKQSRFVPVRAQIDGEVPIGFERDEAAFDALQVTVTGPESLVAAVTEAVVAIDLTEQRADYMATLRPVPIDVDGQPIEGLVVEPRTLEVSIPIRQRRDVREVRVRPNIVGELPSGYILISFSYDPQVIYVGGAAAILENLPGTLFTAPISLTDRTAPFELSVPVELPDADLYNVTAQSITVEVEIAPQIVTQQFDGVAVEIVGQRDDFDYAITPTEVAVLATGAQSMLAPLSAADLRVIIDVSGLTTPGSTQIVPTAAISANGETAAEVINLSILPAEIGVTVTARE